MKRKILISICIMIGLGILYNTVESAGLFDESICLDAFNGHLTNNFRDAKLVLEYQVNERQQVKIIWTIWVNSDIMEYEKSDGIWYNPDEVKPRIKEIEQYANEKIHILKCVTKI